MSVILSIGRHERYGRGALSLTPEGAAAAILGAAFIENLAEAPDKVLASPLPRARLTAELRALVWRISEVQICPELDEDAAFCETEALKAELFTAAQTAGWKHIHLVTHQPTVSRICGLDFAPLSPGDVMVWEAVDWKAMEREEKKTSFIRTNEIIVSSPELYSRFRRLYETAIESADDDDLLQKAGAHF